MNDENPVEFPHYQPPNPAGIPLADPQLHKPLMKLIKTMWKLHSKRDPFHSRRHTSRRGKKLQKFY